MYGFFFLFLQRFCVWESLAGLSLRHPPSLFGGRTLTPPPPFPDPSSGPLAWVSLTSASCLRAKPSPRQLRPDWQGLGAWRGGPRACSAASDLPAPGPRLCGEPDKESRAGARCRRREPREDEVGAEEWTCPPWAGGAAGCPGLCGGSRLCTGCAVADLRPGAGRCLEVRCGEVSPAASARTSASGRCAGMGCRRFGTLVSGPGLLHLPQRRHLALPAGVCGGGSRATFPGHSGGQGWLAVLGRGREGRGLLSPQSAGVGAGEVAGHP